MLSEKILWPSPHTSFSPSNQFLPTTRLPGLRPMLDSGEIWSINTLSDDMVSGIFDHLLTPASDHFLPTTRLPSVLPGLLPGLLPVTDASPWWNLVSKYTFRKYGFRKKCFDHLLTPASNQFLPTTRLPGLWPMPYQGENLVKLYNIVPNRSFLPSLLVFHISFWTQVIWTLVWIQRLLKEIWRYGQTALPHVLDPSWLGPSVTQIGMLLTTNTAQH